MILAFSTIGCPSWSFDDILSTASDLGYNAIEIRGVGGEIYAPNIKQFLPENREITTARLKKLNLEISMLTSGATLAVYGDGEKSLNEAKAYIDLASKLSVPFVRVMCTNHPEPGGGDIVLCKKQYKELIAYSEGKNVLPLMETNGIFTDTALLNSFLEECGGGALWDINHPYRFAGESIETTVKNLGGKICYVHIKDSIVKNGMTKYKMLGYGDIPVKNALGLLSDSGYNGTISFEWVKRWEPDLEEPGIVFSQFISTITRYMK